MGSPKLKRLFFLMCTALLLLPFACAQSGESTQTGKSETAQTIGTAPSIAGGLSFAGKTITIVGPFGAGGSTDIMVRVYSKIMPKYLPGNPGMILRNMPGGGATTGTNYVYRSKPDGLTLLAGSGGAQLAQLVGMKAVHYDHTKMPTMIGLASGGLFYARSSVVGKPEDLKKARGVIYGGSPGASSYLFILAHQVLDFPAEKVVLAYSGTGDSRRAFLSGETNVGYDSAPAYAENIVPLVSKGEVTPLFQTGLLDKTGELVKAHDLPTDMLTIGELYQKLNGKPPSGMAWKAYKNVVAAGRNYDNSLFLPPGASDQVIKTYWSATESMIKDPEFLKIADTIVGKGAPWKAGENYDKEFKLNYKMDPEVQAWFREIVMKYGVVID